MLINKMHFLKSLYLRKSTSYSKKQKIKQAENVYECVYRLLAIIAALEINNMQKAIKECSPNPN